MKNIIKYTAFVLMAVITMAACSPQDGDDHKLGSEPTSNELDFTITPSAATPNVLEIKNTSSRSGVAVWDLGNFSTGKGNTIDGTYPFKGEYTITMTLYTTGGSTSISKNITITNDDFNLLDTPMYNALTGGFENTEGKTWVFDQNEDGHFGVYPDNNSWSWNAAANEKATSSLYKQEFTFSMSRETGLKLVWKNNGKVYTNDAGRKALAELGYSNATHPEGDGDYDVEFTPKASYSFVINEVSETLTLTEGAFLGHYTGATAYNIAELTDDKLEVNCKSAVESGNNWKYRFIPKK
jgi:hypothetical protein